MYSGLHCRDEKTEAERLGYLLKVTYRANSKSDLHQGMRSKQNILKYGGRASSACILYQFSSDTQLCLTFVTPWTAAC